MPICQKEKSSILYLVSTIKTFSRVNTSLNTLDGKEATKVQHTDDEDLLKVYLCITKSSST